MPRWSPSSGADAGGAESDRPLLGGIVGPAFGGAVLGVSLRAPFFLYAGTLVLAAVVATCALLGLRVPRPKAPEH